MRDVDVDPRKCPVSGEHMWQVVERRGDELAVAIDAKLNAGHGIPVEIGADL
jgi:hypothetical protein